MTITQEQSDWFAESFSTIAKSVELSLMGKRPVIELVLTALISEGHVLLEDYPGTGKTTLARAISQSIAGTSSRIQFTPDLLPGDVTGVSVFDQKKGEFNFHAGPIFANIVLADEINRASPKTQAALLEVMEESKVTVDGISREVGVPFLVIATQNPVEQAGTYRLPEAQLDRFMIKTSIGYPDHSATLKILEGTAQVKTELTAVATTQNLVTMSDLARGIYVDAMIYDYIARIVEATRLAPQVRMGSSVRGARALATVSRTWAAAHGRNFVSPDDIKHLASSVLSHRIILDPEAEFDGVTAEQVVGQILLDVLAPSK